MNISNYETLKANMISIEEVEQTARALYCDSSDIIKICHGKLSLEYNMFTLQNGAVARIATPIHPDIRVQPLLDDAIQTAVRSIDCTLEPDISDEEIVVLKLKYGGAVTLEEYCEVIATWIVNE